MIPARVWLRSILALLGTLVVFAWLSRAHPSQPLNGDGLRDQLLVRDCIELGYCRLIGPPSSVAGVYHGAAWLDLLVAVRALGGGVSASRIVVLFLLALSVTTLFIVVWRWLNPALALPAMLFFLAALSADPTPSLLISPSASAFADVLTACALLCYALSGRRRFLIVAAFALGVGINLHVGSASLIPALLALAILARPRAWREVFAALLVLSATYCLTSRAALVANVAALVQRREIAAVLMVNATALLLCVAYASRFRRLSWNVRACLCGLILIVPFLAGAFWLVFVQQHHFSIFYLHPVIAPLATLAAALAVLPFMRAERQRSVLAWVPSAAILVAFLVAERHVLRAPRVPLSVPWTLNEAESIATAAAQSGWNFERLAFHLQSESCLELLVNIGVTSPPPGVHSDGEDRQLQIIKTQKPNAARNGNGFTSIALPSGGMAGLREIGSWLRPRRLLACRMPLAAPQEKVCTNATPPDADALAPSHFLFASRADPEIHNLMAPQPFVASYEIPLVAVAGGERAIAVRDAGEGNCSWRITRVDGMVTTDPLPAQQVRLRAGQDGRGVIVLEKTFGASACGVMQIDNHYPPCMFEIMPEDRSEDFWAGS